MLGSSVTVLGRRESAELSPIWLPHMKMPSSSCCIPTLHCTAYLGALTLRDCSYTEICCSPLQARIFSGIPSKQRDLSFSNSHFLCEPFCQQACCREAHQLMDERHCGNDVLEQPQCAVSFLAEAGLVKLPNPRKIPHTMH